jgi:hypothetical protein
MQYLYARRRLKRQCERFLVAVDGEEVGGFAGCGFLGSSAFDVRGVGGTPGSCVVAAGGVFDFDDFGA